MKKKWIILVAPVIAIVAIVVAVVLTRPQNDNPEDLEPGDKPGDSETTDKPGDSESADKPGDSESVDKPGNSESVDKPDESEPADKPKDPLTFEEFLKLTPAEQEAYMNSYEDIMDFLEWYRTAEEQYKEERPGVDIGGGGDIDIGDFIN